MPQPASAPEHGSHDHLHRRSRPPTPSSSSPRASSGTTAPVSSAGSTSGRAACSRARCTSGSIVDIAAIELGQTAGAVALAEDGGLLVAAARGLATISADGTVSFGPDLLGDRRDVRLNDGSVDPQGRFVVGTLALGAETGDEVLLRVSPDGTVETLRTGIRLSNGIAFSPDGGTIYHVDTLANTVSSHSYGPGAFDPDEPWVTVLAGPPALPRRPHRRRRRHAVGRAVGRLQHPPPRPTGELLDVVSVDATQASCPAFVGPTSTTLAITTAQEGLEDWTDASGAIFLADVGATGLPVPRWRGSTTTPYWNNDKEAHA